MERTAVTKPDTNLGTVKDLTFKLTKPFKFEVNNMEVNQLNLYVGQNGSGKSFVLKSLWAMNMSAMLYLNNRSEPNHLPGMQFIFDKTFSDNDITGLINVKYKNGTLALSFDKGKIVNISSVIPDDIDQAITPIYMGKDMRTFDQLRMYYKYRNKLDLPEQIGVTHLKEYEDLLDMFKIYDVFYAELMLTRLRQEMEFPEQLLTSLKNFDENFDITAIGYDEDACAVYLINSRDEKYFAHTLGAGHQSLLNMFFAQTVF